MAVTLVAKPVLGPDSAAIVAGIQIVYLDPYHGALSLGGAAGDSSILASDFSRLREAPESRFYVRLFDQHHHLLDERAVDPGQIMNTFGVNLGRRVVAARAA